MFKSIFEYYDLSSYSDEGGYGTMQRNPLVGLPDGTFPIHIKYKDETEDDLDDEDTSDFDDVDISKKTGGFIGMRDSFGGRRDNQSFVTNSRLSLAETHTNPIRPGISPYKMKGFTGSAVGTDGANQAFRTTGPGRKTSGPYGNSRATYPRSDEDLEPLMFGDDIVNKYERSLRKHQRKLKKIKNLIKELDNL